MLNVIDYLLPFWLMVEIDFNSLDIPTPVEFIDKYFIENIQEAFIVYLSALAAVSIMKKLINF
ncbi:MAG: hypothetical protein QNJ64_16350 [Crocosphaera sp.]|nr:hypothetical protein [Crocosphaera sp.]